MLRIHLFGSLRLTYNDQPYRFTALPKTLPLLAYLLLHQDQPIARNRLAFSLWPDVDEERARSNLRRHLYELRKALPPTPGDAPWFEADAAGAWWNRGPGCWVDVDAFLELSRDPATLAEAVELYTGDLLPEVDEEWLLFTRERLRTLFFDTLERLVAHHRSQGDRMAAVTCATRLLQHDPLREETVRAVMTLRAELGDPTGALLEYRRFDARLRAELEVAPAVETNALYDAIARQVLAPVAHSTPAAPAPTVEAATARPHNLPAQLTSFVGRTQELAELQAMLGRRQEPVRLLTLTGPGGSGKSRLALEAATRMLPIPDLYRDGIYFVPLAALDDPAGIPQAIASALTLAEASDQPLTMQLVGILRARRLLLILDNFEHLAGGASFLVELLAASPGLAVLVTSRATLRVYGEQEYPLAPLPLPDVDDLPAFAALAHNPAVELFVIRSRAANAAFVLRPADAPSVAAICVRLDGLPLAIELAAARSKMYPPQALLERLTRRLDFLENRAYGAERRHQTLRATLDWSYRLLGRHEQELLAALTVFAQSFTLEGAEAVCGGDGAPDVLSTLAFLCDQSLVQPQQATQGTRFAMLTTVHEYAAAQLTAGARAPLQRRHAEYYVNFSQQVARELYGARQVEWLEMARQEEDNLRAAFHWAFAPGHDDGRQLLGMRMAKALARYWQIAGRLGEGRAWLNAAVTVRAGAPVDLQVEVLSHAGLFAQLQGDFAAAAALHEEVFALASDSGHAALVAQALYALGTAAGRSGEAARANALFAECLAIRRSLPPAAVTEAQMALTLNNLAVSFVFLGDYAQAQQLLEESLALKRASGDQVAVATALVNLGDVAFRQGDYGRAAALQRESLQLRTALADQLGMARGLDHMAELAVVHGDHAAAATLFAASVAAHAAIGATRPASTAQEVEERLATVRAVLSQKDFAAASARGTRMTLDEAVRFALARTS